MEVAHYFLIYGGIAIEMRRASVEDTKQIEKQTFDVAENAHLYFNDVIAIEGFILAVDETGAYFFTTLTDQNTILVKLSNYMEQLALTKNEITVCKVFWDAPEITDDVYFKKITDTRFSGLQFVDVNPECFEQTIRLLLSNRPVVFSREDVTEIVECFKQAESTKDSLWEFLQNKGIDIPKDAADEFERHPVITLRDVINNFGEENAEEILNAMIEYRNTYQCSLATLEADLTKYEKTKWEGAANLAALMGILSLLAALLFCIVRIPVLAFIFSIIALLQARHLALIYKSVTATILTWFGLAMLLFTGCEIILVFKPEIIAWLQSMLLIKR